MNHGYPPPRAMVPQGGPSQRLNELLDNIRTEFETESQRSVDYEGQSKSQSHSQSQSPPPPTLTNGGGAPISVSFDGLTRWAVSRHINEIELIRSKVYSLESQHNQMKAKYATPMPCPPRPCERAAP